MVIGVFQSWLSLLSSLFTACNKKENCFQSVCGSHYQLRLKMQLNINTTLHSVIFLGLGYEI